MSVTAHQPPPKRTALGLIGLAVKSHMLPALLMLAYFALLLAMRAPEAPPQTFDPSRLAEVLAEIIPIFLLGGAFILYFRLILGRRQERPAVRLRRWLLDTPWVDVLVFRVPLALAFIAINQTIYLGLKVSIPFTMPFSWDAAFIAADRLLFLGYDPWELTHAIFSTPLATFLIDRLYVIWFFVVYLGFLGFAVLPMTSEVRLGFLIAFGLGWGLGGSAMATYFSSAGPVYFERLTGDATFAPLMERLATQAEDYRIIALIVQQTLWDGYTLADVPSVGISAFPSMHCCISAVVACAAFGVSRTAGWVLTAFTATVVIGSVHLGWHYAVDSIAGILLGILFYWMGLRAARWWLRVVDVAE